VQAKRRNDLIEKEKSEEEYRRHMKAMEEVIRR